MTGMVTAFLDGLDHAGVGHAGDASGGADHGGDALEGHDGDGSGLLGDDGLLDVHDVHDDAAFEHLGEAGLEAGGRWIQSCDCRCCSGRGIDRAWGLLAGRVRVGFSGESLSLAVS